MTKTSITTESGRSMVEMLGVLAIIGVLSVGGIAGYRTAMNSHRANETVDRLMKRAMIVSPQLLLGQTADISGFSTTDGAYTISDTVDTATAGKFKLTVNAVPQKVCEKIKSYDWTLPVIIPGTCGETNDMTFTFNNDLSANTTASAGTGDPSEPPAVVACTSNSQCTESHTFCKMNSVSSGTCEPTSTYGTVAGEGFITASIQPMNYWSALNWCVAVGKSGLIDPPGSCMCSLDQGDRMIRELFGVKRAYAERQPGGAGGGPVAPCPWPDMCSVSAFWASGTMVCAPTGSGTISCSSASPEAEHYAWCTYN